MVCCKYDIKQIQVYGVQVKGNIRKVQLHSAAVYFWATSSNLGSGKDKVDILTQVQALTIFTWFYITNIQI